MKSRLVALFLLLLVLPLGLALWLGLRSLEDGQVSALTQARAVWSGPVSQIRTRVAEFVQRTEERLRKADASDPLVQTVFRLRGGEVVEPARYRTDGSADLFFSRTATLWERRFWERGTTERSQAPTAGWVAWAGTEGPAFLYWFHDGTEVRGVELSAWPFLSLLSAELPELNWTTTEGAERSLVLSGVAGDFQRWGHWDAGEADPVLTLNLAAPFEDWSLRLSLAPSALGATQTQWVWLFVLVGVGLSGVVGLGAWFFVRTLGASLAEAAQRVRFVNQVSHELKTPLTNILLYGELLEGNLPPESKKAHEYLDVIRGESGRLGRLITNVLTFARGPDAPRLRTLVWDEAVDAALKPFRPGLTDRGLILEWNPGAGVQGEWDADWVGQILGNLVSNAEKYAAAGRLVRVSTGSNASSVWLRVSDRGPGIPAAAAERVFVPFARLDDRLTSGAAGTGLGLGIARDLARRHGGDLVLERSETGASFFLTLPWESS